MLCSGMAESEYLRSELKWFRFLLKTPQIFWRKGNVHWAAVCKPGHIGRHTVILNESLVSVLWFWDYTMRAGERDSFLRSILLFLLLVRLPVRAGSRGKKQSSVSNLNEKRISDTYYSPSALYCKMLQNVIFLASQSQWTPSVK